MLFILLSDTLLLDTEGNVLRLHQNVFGSVIRTRRATVAKIIFEDMTPLRHDIFPCSVAKTGSDVTQNVSA